MDGIVLRVENLEVKLGGRTIVKGITFSLADGEVLGIVGPNGVGKTTLLKTIAGILKAREGRVRAAAKAFMVPQNNMLLPWKTLEENILLAHPSPGSPHAKRELDKIAGLLGLSVYLKKYPRHVSGGTRRKTAVARALISGARLLLFDEPFTGLDVATTSTLLQYLARLREEGYPMIIVSHQLAELAFIADRVLILNGEPGKIVGEVNLNSTSGLGERVSKLRSALEAVLEKKELE